jgi:hypothetical protein
MYLTNLKKFMFARVIWTTPVLATQKVVKKERSDQKKIWEALRPISEILSQQSDRNPYLPHSISVNPRLPLT